VESPMTIGSGPAETDCAGCAKPIIGGQSYLMFKFTDGRPLIRFHDVCERIWDDERHRPSPRVE
jgi:hypothetical protein